MKLTLANVEEFYLPVINGLPGPSREGWRRASELVAGSSFFWGEGERTLVLPAPVGAALAEELGGRLNAGVGAVLFPENPVESLAGWLGQRLESEGFASLFTGGAASCEVLAWGQTPALSNLLDQLRIYYGEASSGFGDDWTLPLVGQIDSKAGLRHLLTTCSGVSASWMAEGFVAENLTQAAQLAEECLGIWGGCVVKSDRSAAGWGIVFFDGSHPPRFPIARHLAYAARVAPELRRFPPVVERLVRRGGRVHSVSAQGYSDGSGAAIFHFLASHLNSGGGALVGRGIMEKEIEAAMRSRFTEVATLLSSLGYKGMLGVDFALDGEGNPLVLEVNPRRTTLTAAFDGARRLGIGDDEADFCVLCLPEIEGATSWNKLAPEAGRLLYPMGGMTQKSGWLPIPAPGFASDVPEWRGALVFAHDAGSADALAGELTDALRQRR